MSMDNIKDRNPSTLNLPGFESAELSHNTKDGYRAIAKLSHHDERGDYQRVDFDIYGGAGRTYFGATHLGDCHISVEERKEGKQRAAYASAVLTLEQMRGLRDMLNDAIERADLAQRTVKLWSTR